MKKKLFILVGIVCFAFIVVANIIVSSDMNGKGDTSLFSLRINNASAEEVTINYSLSDLVDDAINKAREQWIADWDAKNGSQNGYVGTCITRNVSVYCIDRQRSYMSNGQLVTAYQSSPTLYDVCNRTTVPAIGCNLSDYQNAYPCH